jgi:hypothetical protein
MLEAASWRALACEGGVYLSVMVKFLLPRHATAPAITIAVTMRAFSKAIIEATDRRLKF